MLMRLAKYLAQAGVASRRGAEEIIFQGRVEVNGVIVKVPQTPVSHEDSVTVDGKPVGGPAGKLYLLLNKPAGYISTVKDTHGRPTVMDLISDLAVRLYPVGRLDADTSGVLLLTNDGELSYRLTHPRYGVKKIYHVQVSGYPSSKDLEELSGGVVIDGAKTAPVLVRILERFNPQHNAYLEITMIEGKKRQVKRICKAIGHPVITLHRFSFAGIEAGDLREGAYRFLKTDEVNRLYQLVGLEKENKR
jgi:23S rRNA pseudouridine2605 synthase